MKKYSIQYKHDYTDVWSTWGDLGIFLTINGAKNRLEQEMNQPINSLLPMKEKGIYTFLGSIYKFRIVDQFGQFQESPWKTDFAKFM